ncbi:MAG: glycosyltransferase family 4 protein [Candidatus Omnitrophica bacterium]|nr:glycosyltransferase family 4 protein [Candidatus Omnitrophota bacterium]
MMKILLLTTHINIGGVGFYTVNLAKYLRKMGHEPVVVSSGGDLEELLQKADARHIKMDLKTKAEFGFKVAKAILPLTRLVQKEGFDVIHAQTRVAQVAGGIVSKITRVPIVSTGHGFFKHERLFRKLFPFWGDKIIAISESVRGHLINDFHIDEKKITVVYNGIELDRFLRKNGKIDQNMRDKMSLDRDLTIVGAIGRLSSVKGYIYLIKAFKKVAEKNKNARLLLVGEGDEKPKLEKEVKEAGLTNKVIFESKKMATEDYLSVMDIFCQPSIKEGLGLALIEAMASGRACIGSNVGGIPEIIDDEIDGILVPPENPEALAEAITRLLSDAELKQTFSTRAPQKAQTKFSIEENARKTAEVYEEARS